MTNKNMTRRDALTIAIQTMQETAANAEAIAVLVHMVHQLDKQAERKAANGAAGTKTQARRDNEAAAKEIADMVEVGDRINGAWLQNHSPYCGGQFVINSFQKATAVMNVAGDWDKRGKGLGLFTKVMDGKDLWYERV